MTIESWRIQYHFSTWQVFGLEIANTKRKFSILNHNPAPKYSYFTNTNAGYWWTNTHQTGDNQSLV
jgi:hypothetical protein